MSLPVPVVDIRAHFLIAQLHRLLLYYRPCDLAEQIIGRGRDAIHG